MEYCF